MTGYVFTYGVDGFGEDVGPAHEVGIYLDYHKAFERLVELNSNVEDIFPFYEEGYGEDHYPETDTILAQLDEQEDWEAFCVELNKHKITDIRKICQQIIKDGIPPFGMYCLEEIEIHE